LDEKRSFGGDIGSVRLSPREVALGQLVARRSRRVRFGVVVGWLVELPVVGRLIARVTRLPNRLRASRRVTRLHAWLLRKSGGRFRRSYLFAAGQPVLSLTTSGRKSGLPRSTAVACFEADGELVVAGMNLGLDRDPAWALNLSAEPNGIIHIDGKEVPITARRAAGAEAQGLWRRWVELQPSAEAFQDLADREIPLFVLTGREVSEDSESNAKAPSSSQRRFLGRAVTPD
jgi:deazaflavin-dependent oxidoreductase (nitroreductase family)